MFDYSYHSFARLPRKAGRNRCNFRHVTNTHIMAWPAFNPVMGPMYGATAVWRSHKLAHCVSRKNRLFGGAALVVELLTMVPL